MNTTTMIAPKTDDDTWIDETLSGNENAFTNIMTKYRDRLYHLIVRMLWNPAEAEDVLQESFLEAFKHLASFSHRSRLSTWLYSIALNRARNRLRHNKLLKWMHLDFRPTDDDDAREIELCERGASLETQVEGRMELQAIAKQIEALPTKYQSIFTMYYFEGLSIGEVADVLKRPVGTIKVYLHRARKLLHRQMQNAPFYQDLLDQAEAN